MAVPKEIASIKRFGVRYGRSLKERMGKIEAEQRKLHRCPYCGKMSVKWQAIGIWLCKKCGSTPEKSGVYCLGNQTHDARPVRQSAAVLLPQNGGEEQRRQRLA